jgi:hypothetical protein
VRRTIDLLGTSQQVALHSTVQHDVLFDSPSKRWAGRQQRHDCGCNGEQGNHCGNKEQHAMPERIPLRSYHDLIPHTPPRDFRRRVSGCRLPYPVLSLAQRFEGLPVGAAFRNSALPAAILHHDLDLVIDTVTVCASAHFRHGHARDETKGQCQKKLSRHCSLHEAGA